jgi:NodT family efflux transporter outer membrane factor (OMF) lipoprotein
VIRPTTCITAMLLAPLSLYACTVGPDFNKPVLNPAAGYLRHNAASIAIGSAPVVMQTLLRGGDVPAHWWEAFNSAELNHLVEAAVANNPDLASAQAALRSAHATLAAERGALFPEVDAAFTASRQRNSVTLASPLNSNEEDYSLYTGQISIGYAPDVFGGLHRQIETAEAQAENQRYTVEAAYLTLTANVVVAAIQLASFRGQIRANEEVIETDQSILDAFRTQVRLGEASAGDVAAQQATLAQARAMVSPLRKQLGQQEHLLAQLTGKTPAEFESVEIDLSNLRLPSELPLSLPSKLVEQRPDVRAAEANLHSASAQVGVAIANRLPNISLSAALGGASTDIASLVSGGNALWSVTGGITQPIFDAGALRDKQRAAEALLDQAKAQYRSVVLTAFQNVADALLALKADAAALDAELEAVRAAQRSLAIARLRLERGEANSGVVLNAQQTYQQALSGLIQAQAARYSDTAGLYQALGGGWWNRGEADLAIKK